MELGLDDGHPGFGTSCTVLGFGIDLGSGG